MKKPILSSRILIGLLILGVSPIQPSQAAAPDTPQNSVTVRLYNDIGAGTAITDLTNSEKFRNNRPDEVRYEPYFELWATGTIGTAPAGDVRNNFGAMIEGYFYPPTTGDYTFYIAADDNAQLFLSTDDDPANKKLIAIEPQWNPVRAFTATDRRNVDTPENSSATYTASQWATKGKITLQANQPYYIQALVKEGGGGDNLAVAVADPNNTIDSTLPIPGQYLSPAGVATAASILSQPQNAAVFAGGSATFSVGLDVPPGVTLNNIKWTKNGTDVPNSNTNTLRLAGVTAADNNAKIQAVITTSAGTLTSQEVTLNVATFANEFAQGVVKFEAFNDIGGGTAVADLTGHAKYTDNTPDDIRLLAGIDTPSGYGDNYGAKVSGFITPPESGDYHFFIRSDDASQLWLSTDATEANAQLIAEETACCQAFLEPGASQTTTAPITLTAGQRYAFYALVKEGGGGDYLQVAARREGDTTAASSLRPLSGAWIGANAKPNVGEPQITLQPAAPSRPVIEGTSVTLSVAGTVTPAAYNFPALYQWQKDGQAIPGAAGSTFEIRNATNTHNGAYRAVVSAPSGNSVTSAVVTITVVPDTFPPEVVGATAFPGTTKIGLMFDEDVEAVSAGTAANYMVNDVAVSSALVRTNVANELTNEKHLVQLTVPTPLTINYKVTVTGVKDLKGNTMTSKDFTGRILNLTSTDIGSPAGENESGQRWGPDPQEPSEVITWGPGAFDVLTTGSNDYWNNADGFHFLWEPKTNSFDVKVRVVSVSPINNWTAGAIEVREGPPTANGQGWELARHYFCKVDYGGPGAIPVLDGSGDGADSYEFNARLAPGDPTKRETSNDAPGGSVGWGGAGPGNPSPVPFPNAWIRIARVKTATSDHLLGYSSSDGVNWSLRQDVDLNDAAHAGFLNLAGQPAGPWPDVCYVGLGSTSHTGFGNNNDVNNGNVGEFWYSRIGEPYSAWIIYRDYGDFAATIPPPTGGPTISAVRAANNLTITFTGTLESASSITGPWTAETGASPLTVPTSTGTKFYRARQ